MSEAQATWVAHHGLERQGSRVSTEIANNPFSEHVLRSTRQRRSVVSVVSELDAFASAQSIHEALLARGDLIGLSTVYRTLQALVEAGAVDAIRARGGEILYRCCGPQRHHHLVCLTCGRAIEISLSAVDEAVGQAASNHGFTGVTLTLELFGLCPSCSA